MNTTDTTHRRGPARAFVGQSVTDIGAAISGLRCHIGARSASTRRWRRRADHVGHRGRPTGTANGTSSSGLGNPGRRRYVTYDRPDGTYRFRPSRPWWSPTRTPVFLGGAFEARVLLADHHCLTDAFRTAPGQAGTEQDTGVFPPRSAALFPARLRRAPVTRGLPHWTGGWAKGSVPGRALADVAAGSVPPRSFMGMAFGPVPPFFGLPTTKGLVNSARKAAAESGVAPRTSSSHAPPASSLHGPITYVHVRTACTTWRPARGRPASPARPWRRTATLLLVEPESGDAPRGELTPVGDRLRLST